MKIGMTYDLREEYLQQGYSPEQVAELDSPVTIASLETTLNSLGYQTEKIGGLRNLVERLAQGERWDLVFNICEGMGSISREAQVPALLDGYGIPYTFSDPSALAVTQHKGMAKRVMRDLGILTPDFAIMQTIDDVQQLSIPYPVFAKPVAEGTSKGIGNNSKINSRDQLQTVVSRLLNEYKQPVLVEKYLPGREFTVGLVGTGQDANVLGVMEILIKNTAAGSIYSFDNKANYEQRVEYRLADKATAELCAAVAIAAWRGLGCRDGGRVDVKLDEQGQPHVLEINPLAGLHPGYSDMSILTRLVGSTYKELIATIMESARKRVHPCA